MYAFVYSAHWIYLEFTPAYGLLNIHYLRYTQYILYVILLVRKSSHFEHVLSTNLQYIQTDYSLYNSLE